jgi:hypothetical protein
MVEARCKELDHDLDRIEKNIEAGTASDKEKEDVVILRAAKARLDRAELDLVDAQAEFDALAQAMIGEGGVRENILKT